MRKGRMVANFATKLEEAKGGARPAVMSDAVGSGVWPWADERVREILGAAAYPHRLAGENPGLIFAMEHPAERAVKQEQVDPNVREAQMELERSLGVRVQIKDRNGKGKILIEYKSLEDFDRVVEVLSGKD